jgi:Ulp1 family protease
MSYVLLFLSLAFNAVLIWYVRKILTKYWYDVEARKSFVEMLNQYEEALTAIYKLEEFYGEETLKKAINQTKFVVQACEEFKQILEKDNIEETENKKNSAEEDEEGNESKKEEVIRLKEGESVSQDASTYKRVTTEFI